ncbi:MAG: gliding motility-associated C-terminal domain-containing protein, partial [Ginsengibacter sp.]
SFSQCPGAINTFPYIENFETSNGGWSAGGNFSDWTWGIPAKPVINSAVNGFKCWLAGGLSKVGYNDNEMAWIQSPCFNFTNLKDPYIKFNLFWETERDRDGANLQYSTDNGATWQLLGGANESGVCLSEKWYNDVAIPALGNKPGWSGNIQGSRSGCIVSNGSGAWNNATHTISQLAGSPSVIFRFVFGSGNGCNDFDGFAIDNFSIQEAPPGVAAFTYNCSSNLRVNFANTSTLCPKNFLWDFGDPSSGSQNTSTDPNPTHAYTIGGIYKVSLTVYSAGGSSSTYILPNLEIISNIRASIINPIRCHDDTTGIITVEYTGDASAISYSWDTKPVQTTRTATGLGAGDYNVTILNSEGCPASANISLGEPPPLLYTIDTILPDCKASNGKVSLTMSGGSAPYAYTWAPGVSNNSVAANIPAGLYKVFVIDNNLCYKTIDIDLPAKGDLAATITSAKDASCFGGSDGMASFAASGGTKPYAYLWSAQSASNQVINNIAAGTYKATVTDSKGCKAFATAIINQPAALISSLKIKNTFCGYNNGAASIDIKGGTSPYQYLWDSLNISTVSTDNLSAGSYPITITDKNGCVKNDTAVIAPSSPLLVNTIPTNVVCSGGETGSITATATGGTSPYTFQWTNFPNTFNQNTLSNLQAGIYEVLVEDLVGCSVRSSIEIKEPSPLNVIIQSTSSYCQLSNGKANVAVTGGTPPYNYLWAANNNTRALLNNAVAGNYSVTVTDKNNCSVSSPVIIADEKPKPIFLGNDTSLCPGNNMLLSPGTFAKYKWQDNSAASSYHVMREGIYSVEVTDNLGCVLRDTISVVADCGFIFFPNSFTPNNDLLNDNFGPSGILSTLKDYTLLIYNRTGQLVFKSNDAFKKWDGKMRNEIAPPGIYVWVARYSHKEEKNVVRKGTVTVLY